MRRSITVVLAAAVLASTAACGSRASDQDIVEALRGPAGVTGFGAAPGVGDGVGVGAVDAGVPAAGGTGGAVAPSVPAPGGSSTTAGGAAAGGSGAGTTSGGTAAKPGATGSKPAAATTTSGPKVANKSVITIGTIGSFSGVLGAVTAGAPKSVAAWVGWKNDNGGLNGHPIKLIVGDDQGDPATALTLAKRMVESDKILALVGDIHFFGYEQIEPYMRSKGVPMVGGEGALANRFNSPVNFPISAQGSVQIVKGLKMYTERGHTKMGMLYCLEIAALCATLHDEVKASEVGKYIVQSYQVSLVAPSYTSQCLRMKQGGLEVIYMLMDTAGAARLAKDCAAQGFKPKLLLLGLDVTKDMPTIPSLADALLPGATVSPGAKGVPAVDHYLKLMDTYAPGTGVSGFGAQAFASALMFGHVGQNISDTPTSAELLAALYKVRKETLGGFIVPVTYSKTGTTAAPCVFIWGAGGGKFTAPEGAKPLC
ncbi:ABC transporter substrate-binding protein [Sporichthya polymorpha]|uniref:ABC transporter substrate-binding protein n=1 Tax=Sporichthya polymorpha TaxID=35751 RepID=UPI0003708E3F|nr:ABC transporter substrate-binding protein [Sporichthya polymorpha]